MDIIPLEAIPSQEIIVNLSGFSYKLKFKATDTLMVVDVSINENLIISGQRCVQDQFLIPYLYLSDDNFIFTTKNETYPYYTLFGSTQFLGHFTKTEIRG